MGPEAGNSELIPCVHYLILCILLDGGRLNHELLEKLNCGAPTVNKVCLHIFLDPAASSHTNTGAQGMEKKPSDSVEGAGTRNSHVATRARGKQ